MASTYLRCVLVGLLAYATVPANAFGFSTGPYVQVQTPAYHCYVLCPHDNIFTIEDPAAVRLNIRGIVRTDVGGGAAAPEGKD